VRWLLVAILITGMFGAGLAHGKKKPQAPPVPADLPGHVNYLARQLYGLHLDESEPVTSQIQKLVIDRLDEWMAETPLSSAPGDVPVDVKVRRQLEDAFSQLHYPLFGQPAVFAEAWKGETLIGAGYTLGWSDYDRVNVLALFEIRQGKSQLAAVTNFVPRTDLHYEVLRSPQTDQFRFFVYGIRLGKDHPRLSVMLYSFDGQALKSLWETRDVYDGKMDVDRDRVVIRYLREDEYIRETTHRRRPPRHEAIYRITPQGLELETDHEIPF